MITTTSTRFEFELIKSLEVEKERITANMVAGQAITDYVTYRENVANIRALNCVIDFCEDIRAQLAKER